MADDAATRRREARRRRILMNSEGRLKKVLDLNKLKPDVEPEAKEVIVVDKEREQFVDVDNKNKAVVDNSDYAVFNSTTQLDSILSCVSEPEEKSLFSNIQATSVETDEDEKGTLETTLQKREESDEKAKKNFCGRKAELVANSETKENCDDENVTKLLQDEVTSERSGSSDIINCNGDVINESLHTHLRTELDTPSTPLITPLQKTKQKPQKSYVRELMALIVGIVVRLILAVNVINIKYVLMPFFTVEAAALTIHVMCQDKSLIPSSGLVTMALMLCGFQQKTLEKISIAVYYISNISTDLAVYLFSFIMVHSMLDILN